MECSKGGCIKPVFSGGMCHSCYDKDRLAKAPKCSINGCGSPSHAKNLCSKHYRQELNKEKPLCIIDGCGRVQHAHELCGAHYTRKLRHGHLDPTRPSDWGAKEKHPLYHVWGTMKRKRGIIHISQEWLDDFWIFIRDVGERPSPRHTFRLKKESKGYVNGNVYWKEPVLDSIKAKNKREYNAKYAKKMRENNPSKAAEYDYKRRYGITLDVYHEMFKDQNGVCAICGNKETAVDRTTQETRRLAVDHCHKTGKVRALLCTNCNTLIGRANDSVEVLKSAITYLEKFK